MPEVEVVVGVDAEEIILLQLDVIIELCPFPCELFRINEGQWGRVSCSILSGLLGPIGLLRGGQELARETIDAADELWEVG